MLWLQHTWRVFCVGLLLTGSVATAETIDFNRDIRPILSDKCFFCHGPDAAERQGGGEMGLRLDTQAGAIADLGGYAAVVPGKPDESELIRRISAADPEERMPPAGHRKSLTERQRNLLRDWIQQGAAWADHWAYLPPQRGPVPEVRDAAWPVNAVDRFILSRLESEGIPPSAEAHKRILLRRLHFDLIGLPPNRQQMLEFLTDDSPDVYERLVDRLLDSQHFGERMAMQWLDLVRYADSVGYHGDQSVSVSPYRDYVIQAFNDNLPFDRFTREQLGGDLLPNPTRDQLVASGYNKLGMMSAEGGVQPKEYLAKYAADRVRTVASVWLGSTLGCAECHDHKFDPFRTKDFYQMAAFFADIKERGLYAGAHADGNWGPTVEVPDEELPALLKPVDEELARLEMKLQTATPELIEAERNWIRDYARKAEYWEVPQVSAWTAEHETKLEVLDDGSLLASGPSAVKNNYSLDLTLLRADVAGIRIDVLPDDSLPQRGPGRAGNGNFVLTELKLFELTSDGKIGRQLELRNAVATVEQKLAGEGNPYKTWNAASTIDNDEKGSEWGWAVLPEVGKANRLIAEVANAQELTGPRLRVVLEQQHGTQHTLGRFRIALTRSNETLKQDGPLPPLEVAAALSTEKAERSEEQKTAIRDYYLSIAPSLEGARQKLAALKKKRAELVQAHTRTSLVTVSVEPRQMRVLPRGNWMDDSGAVVQPAVPTFLRQLETEGRANRLDLADWLTSRDNPLTARVFVNRLWKTYFGTGLSKVLDDVGAQGEWPTHPALLDALALEFMEQDWNVKHIVKLIVMSRAYRQSSLPRQDLAEVDPFNRLLARQSRFRLDAELVRDNMLAVSQLLVPEIGGRSVKPYQPAGLYRHLNFPMRTYQHDKGESQYRRGLYTHWQRQFLHPAMKAFDAPPREECTAERPRSNTPLAALVMLNDPTSVEAARAFAERTLRESKGETDQDLSRMFVEALSRPASDQEFGILRELAASQQDYYRQRPGEVDKLLKIGLHTADETLDPVQLAAFTAVARTIFNMHEFITRN